MVHPQLLVTVIEGRNLAAKDSNGFSDPFVVIKLGKVHHATCVVYKDLNPVFMDTHTFSVPLSMWDHSTVYITCWDHDTVSNDFMGRITVHMSDIRAEITFKEPGGGSGSFQRWYQLKSRGKLHIDGPISGDLLLKFEIVGPMNIPDFLSEIPFGHHQAASRVILQLQQSHIEVGALHNICASLKADKILQVNCIGLGVMSVLKIHLENNMNNEAILIKILNILQVLTITDEVQEKVVELGYVSILHTIAKYHSTGHTNHFLFIEWTKLLKNISKYPKIMGTIIDSTSAPLFIKLLADETLQESMLSIIYEHTLVNTDFPFNPLLDIIETMLATSTCTVQRLCVKLLVLFSTKRKENGKFLSLIELLIGLLKQALEREDSMSDDILLILYNLSEHDCSARVFIIEEGAIAVMNRICTEISRSPAQRKVANGILNLLR